MTVMCAWAPFDHEAPAAYWLRFERPCGHVNHIAPSCPEHTARARANPVAERATFCPTCGVRGPATLVALADSARNARVA